MTSILAKCMERIRCNQLIASVADRMDTNLFAYKARRDVEDACLVLVNLTASHLDVWIIHTCGVLGRTAFRPFGL